MWMGNFKRYRRTWNEGEILEISSFLMNCNATRPTDLHRSIRSLDYIKRWKATECRTFLLYVGIVALRNRLRQNDYEMFLNLFCAVTICSSKSYAEYLPLAQQLFIDFIKNHILIFGEASITINIHNTSHVVDEVEMYGPIDTISAYPFENHLHHMKRKLKQCDKPLQQIARRITESFQSEKFILSNDDSMFPVLKYPFTLDNDTLCYRFIEYKRKVYLSSRYQNQKDKWFLTFDNEIVEFCHILKNPHEESIIVGTALKNVNNFFEKPFKSEKAEPKKYRLNSVKAKMFCIHLNDSQLVFIPLLHSL